MLDLTFEEQTLLLNLLEEQVRPLSFEISRTDSHDYKAALNRRSQLLDSIIGKLKLTREEQPAAFGMRRHPLES